MIISFPTQTAQNRNKILVVLLQNSLLTMDAKTVFKMLLILHRFRVSHSTLFVRSFDTFFSFWIFDFNSSIFLLSLCHVMTFCLDRAFHLWKFNIWNLIEKSIENMCLFYVRTLLLDKYIRRTKIEKIK